MQTSAIQQLVYSRGFGKSAVSFDSERLLEDLGQGFSPNSPPIGYRPTPLRPELHTVGEDYIDALSNSADPSHVPSVGPSSDGRISFLQDPKKYVDNITDWSGTPYPSSPGSTGTGSLMDGIKGLYHRIKNRYDSLSDNQRLGLGIGAGVLGGAGILGAMELYRRRQQEEEEHKMRMRAFRGY